MSWGLYDKGFCNHYEEYLTSIKLAQIQIKRVVTCPNFFTLTEATDSTGAAVVACVVSIASWDRRS